MNRQSPCTYILGEEFEGFFVLDDMPVLTNIGQDCSGIAAYQGLLYGGEDFSFLLLVLVSESLLEGQQMI